MRPRLQPEDLRRDVASFCVSEQITGNRRNGLGGAAIKLTTKVLAQRLRVAADDIGDVVLRDTDTRQAPHPLAHRIGYGECFSRHLPLLIDRLPGGALVEGLTGGLMHRDAPVKAARGHRALGQRSTWPAGQGHAGVSPAGSDCLDMNHSFVTMPPWHRAWIRAVAPTKRQMLIVGAPLERRAKGGARSELSTTKH
jgi:hypothetical protein